MTEIMSDQILFPLVQIAISILCLVAMVCDKIQRRRARDGHFSAIVTRGNESMAVFYGLYAAATGVLVSLALSVDYARDRRVFYVLADMLLIAYLCLLNPWFRNKVIGLAQFLTKIEER